MNASTNYSVNNNLKILRERADKLAFEEKIDTDLSKVEVLEFLLADEKYALETSYISGVYHLKNLTKIPCTPSFVLGMINVRGQLFSVVDLAVFFDLPRSEISLNHKVIILKSDKMEFGILADEINNVKQESVIDLEISIPTLSKICSEYLKGITKELIIILDGAKILSDKKLIIEEEVI